MNDGISRVVMESRKKFFVLMGCIGMVIKIDVSQKPTLFTVDVSFFLNFF